MLLYLLGVPDDYLHQVDVNLPVPGGERLAFAESEVLSQGVIDGILCVVLLFAVVRTDLYLGAGIATLERLLEALHGIPIVLGCRSGRGTGTTGGRGPGPVEVILLILPVLVILLPQFVALLGLAAEALPAGKVFPGAATAEARLKGSNHVLELPDLQFVGRIQVVRDCFCHPLHVSCVLRPHVVHHLTIEVLRPSRLILVHLSQPLFTARVQLGFQPGNDRPQFDVLRDGKLQLFFRSHLECEVTEDFSKKQI